ncbi:unnamed protein product [Danaus chrysippus]|uniref:(African queen) hypothetical protein n=1 Tax=Danaus chrysippus TaxID=151541 RepID=A0A8J2QKX4_9NEOP|nr:unnamed protein product [Danaus chrysippus]
MEKEKRQRVSLGPMVCEEELKAKGDVGRMVDCSQADDRRLIRLVRERRLLYARNNMPVASFYTQVKALWDEVAAAMGWTGTRAQTRTHKHTHTHAHRERQRRTDRQRGREASAGRGRGGRGRGSAACLCVRVCVFVWSVTITVAVADVRRKWSHIRNSYSRHLRNEMHGACTSKGRMVSRWYLADELEFLREHMATDMRSSPYSSFAPTMLEMDINESSNSESVDVKPFIHSPWFALSAPHSPKPEPRAPPSLHTDDSSGSFAPDETSSYFQFFRGIHNDYQELPPKKQRLFKRKCLSLLHELLDGEENQRASCYSQENNALNLSHTAQHEEAKEQKTQLEDSFILPNN